MTKKITNENRRDNSAKRVFSYRSVVAMLFRGVVPGFKDTDIKVAESYFGTETILTGIGETDPETGLRYDLVFEARIPGRPKPIRIWINIEPQNDSRRMGHLTCRMEYYSANLLVMQKGRTFEGDNYYDMADTYSVWVLMDPPNWMRNKIRHIRLSEQAVYGDAEPPLPFRGMQNVVVIGVGDPEDDEAPEMLKMLDWMMCEGFSRDERRKGLTKLGLTVTKDMEDNILRMNSIDEDRDRRMRDEGREEGLAENRQKLISTLAKTVRKLMENNGWTMEKAISQVEIPDDVRDDVISALNRFNNQQRRTVWNMAGYNLRMNSIDEDRDRRMRDEGREEGIAQGREEGIAQGREEGIAQGREEGIAQGREEGMAEGEAMMRPILVSALANTVRKLMENNGWTMEETLAQVYIPDDVRDDVIAALG